jgi:hypothetical protein
VLEVAVSSLEACAGRASAGTIGVSGRGRVEIMTPGGIDPKELALRVRS